MLLNELDESLFSLFPELIEYFKSQMKEDPDMASAVAAIRTLLEFLKRDKGIERHLLTLWDLGKSLL